MDLKRMLDAQLRGRHAASSAHHADGGANSTPLVAETGDEADVVTARHHDTVASFGDRSVTHAELRDALGAIRRTLDATPFGLSSYQVPTDDTLIQTIVEGYEKEAAKLEPMYAALEAKLTERGVALDQLKVVTMIAAGGCPYREYGLGDSMERGVEMQLSMALEHGVIFDFVPVTFSDFNSHIVSLGVGVGAALLAKLRAREAGRVRMDGVMFACKGTLAAALAARAFVVENGGGAVDGGAADGGAADGGAADGGARLGLFGMGTDLTQGFDEMDDESAAACSMRLDLVAMNSLQDTNVGHGEATKASLEARAARIGGTAVWIDVEARLKEFGAGNLAKFGNPEHGWYPAAFRRKCSTAVKASILSELARVVGATPCDLPDDALDEARGEMAAAVDGAVDGAVTHGAAANVEASEASEVGDVGGSMPSLKSAVEKLRARKTDPLTVRTTAQANTNTDFGSAPRAALMPNAMLLNLKATQANGGVKLAHVETRVTLLKDFVGNEMFQAE